MVAAKQYVSREGGQFERQSFQIAASQEAFRILSDGLYSDKIRAVVRELSTNALDSHLIAGNTKPFEVHLPSLSEPWFSVKDYGTGLSHDEVMHLYSTYFGTNKSEEFLTTGCLGLGSKSPFAKVRSFTVISRYDGMERHYIVAFNEDRIPEVNYLPEQDKPSVTTGMEIKMSVATSDIYEFCDKAGDVYYYFKEEHRPRIINNSCKIPEKEVLISGDGWRMYAGHGTPVAVQGNVGYPISAGSIRTIDGNQQAALSCHLEIDFDNGSLVFTPSREHLSYNKRTCDAILSRIDDIVSEVNSTIEKRFANCKSLWEARCLAWGMFWSENADLKHLRKVANMEKMDWNGQKLAGTRLQFGDITDLEVWRFETKKRQRGQFWNRSEVKTVSKTEVNELSPRSNVEWYEMDIPRGAYSRCHYHVQENPQTTIYLVSFGSKEAKDEFCDKIGLNGDEFVKASALPKPPTNKRSVTNKISRASSLVYEHNGSSNMYRFYEYWKPTDVDLEDEEGGIYVPMKGNRIIMSNGNVDNPSVIGEIVSLVNNVTLEKMRVIGVRSGILKKFMKSDDWVNVFDYVSSVLKIKLGSENIGQHVVNAESLQNFESHGLWSAFVSQTRHLNSVHPDVESPLRVFCEQFKHMEKSQRDCADWNKWIRLAKMFNYEIKQRPTFNLDFALELMYEKFPAIRAYVSGKNPYDETVRTDEMIDLGHYIALVENSLKA